MGVMWERGPEMVFEELEKKENLGGGKKENLGGGEKGVFEKKQLKAELYKTEMCRSFLEQGSCRYGNKCQFAHGYDELRPVVRHPKYRTKKCKNFEKTGTCSYGLRCRFIHEQPRADKQDLARILSKIDLDAEPKDMTSGLPRGRLPIFERLQANQG